MRVHRIIFAQVAIALSVVTVSVAQTPIEVQSVKELKPTGTLATCGYAPTSKEAPFLKHVPDEEKRNDNSFRSYTMHGKVGKSIAWFGIVRGMTLPAAKDAEVTLLVQHHFFDGLTDCHIMLVAKSGDGDFSAKLKVDSGSIPALSLVRIYGTVLSEPAQIPQVRVDYIRVWPWLTFTFTDLAGPDHSNPRWQKYSSVKPGADIYVPYPNQNYYLNVLGDPADFGVNLRAD